MITRVISTVVVALLQLAAYGKISIKTKLKTLVYMLTKLNSSILKKAQKSVNKLYRVISNG